MSTKFKSFFFFFFPKPNFPVCKGEQNLETFIYLFILFSPGEPVNICITLTLFL